MFTNYLPFLYPNICIYCIYIGIDNASFLPFTNVDRNLEADLNGHMYLIVFVC